MEDYNKIIESLNVHYKKINNIKVIQPITIENFYDVENTLFRINQGEIIFGKEKNVVKKGEFLFVPGGKNISLTFGKGTPVSLSNEEFISRREHFFQSLKHNELLQETQDSFSYVSFDAKVFDSVNFFASLDIPAFVVPSSKKMEEGILAISEERFKNEAGHQRVIKLVTDQLVVEVIRHILRQGMFVEQLATNSTYFKDPRLIDIFAYIKDNLNGDLSNKKLANVANVSEDYVGQYFKMLTGINPQDYIEYQRMEQAVSLLRTSKKSIREIGHEVGYKDTAYFCRRFKMMFGIPAGKMRRRESLMNI